jgi:hypothetical protein
MLKSIFFLGTDYRLFKPIKKLIIVCDVMAHHEGVIGSELLEAGSQISIAML